MTEKNYKRYLITSALPYANGPVHIGHLAGVYVPADIYVRYLRMCGRDVLFIGGSDEHGVPITIKAKQQGCTPQDIVDKYHTIIKDSFKEFGISFDVYSRTSSKTHHRVAADFFKKLYEEETGHTSTVHKYYVLRWNEPSNLIPAHLYKDGLRHIHPDSDQARTITVREAARLQTFPDDYVFIGSQMDQYKMIGNAVPPAMSKIIAEAIWELLFKEK